MPITIDYYVISASPFAYLGHKAFHEIAARHGAAITYKPIMIRDVWEKSGSVPLPQRTPTRLRYRRIELQRIAEMRGLKINLEPRHFPVDASLSDRCVVALSDRGETPERFLWEVHQAVWAREQNIAERALLAGFLAVAGHDADAVLEQAEREQAAATIGRNTQDAIAADAIGAPVYVLNGEPFWGQDRLEHLDHALTTGRQPYRG